jgi:hypothetical protein
MEPMKIDGGCHCGWLTFEAFVDRDNVNVCHCTDCQKLSASAFRAVIASKETDFKLLNNKPKDYIKTSDNGTPRIQAFCPECGSHIYATSIDNIGNRIFNIRLGSVVQKDQCQPKKQVWCRSALSWVFNLDNIPRIDKQS